MSATEWAPEHEIVLVNLTLGKMAPADLNGAYKGVVSVNRDTGEVLEGCLECHERENLLRTKERQIRGLELQIHNLKHDRAKQLRDHPRWLEVKALFDHWRRHCRHPRSKFDADRFEEALPLLESYGKDVCERAIEGAGYDAFTTRRRNGTTHRHDGWGLIFRNAEKLEEFVNRCPRETA